MALDAVYFLLYRRVRKLAAMEDGPFVQPNNYYKDHKHPKTYDLEFGLLLIERRERKYFQNFGPSEDTVFFTFTNKWAKMHEGQDGD